MTHQQKITFAEMRAGGVRNVLIYRSDHRCGHFNIMPDDADRWPDELRISTSRISSSAPPAACATPTSGRIGRAPNGFSGAAKAGKASQP
jgi:hypothetical protein